MTPTTNVNIAAAVSALIGLLAWIAAEALSISVPAEVVGSLTTLVVGVLAYISKSAKQTAGAMAAAATAVLVWSLGFADVAIPVEQAGLLNTMFLFMIAWATNELETTDIGAADASSSTIP